MINRIVSLNDESYSKLLLKNCSIKYDKTFDVKGYSNLCDIHNVFKKSKGRNSHSCIACNLSETAYLLTKAIRNTDNVENQFDAFVAFLLPAYLLVERFEEVFRIIKLPDYYELKHFQTFKQIRRWANFLKHPKAFLFVHHPSYYFDDEVEIDNSKNEYVIINSSFIKDHYQGDKNNVKLYSTLINNDKVLVIFPNLLKLVDEFIAAQNLFRNLILNNTVFQEILTEKSVLINYFEELDNE